MAVDWDVANSSRLPGARSDAGSSSILKSKSLESKITTITFTTILNKTSFNKLKLTKKHIKKISHNPVANLELKNDKASLNIYALLLLNTYFLFVI